MGFRSHRGAALAVVVSLLLAGCSDEDPRRARVDEVFVATGLGDLARNSDLIIARTAVAVEPGRVVGSEDVQRQFTQVTIRVDEVFFGTPPGDKVLLEEWWATPEEGSAKDDTGIYFLHLKREATDVPYYRLVSSQGRFLATGDDIVASNDEMTWVQELEGALTPEELEAKVKEVVAEATESPSPSASPSS